MDIATENTVRLVELSLTDDGRLQGVKEFRLIVEGLTQHQALTLLEAVRGTGLLIPSVTVPKTASDAIRRAFGKPGSADEEDALRTRTETRSPFAKATEDGEPIGDMRTAYATLIDTPLLVKK